MDFKRKCVYFASLLTFHLYVTVSSDQWYLNVRIPDVNLNIARQIQNAIALYPETLSYYDGSTVAMVLDKQEWPNVQTVLKPLNVTYLIISDIRKCAHCDDEIELNGRATLQGQYVTEVILAQYGNAKLFLEEALYSLTGENGCIVTNEIDFTRDSKLVGTDCITKTPTINDAWYYRSLNQSRIGKCEDAETEFSECAVKVGTIHSYGFPGYSLAVENNTFFLSNQTPQKLKISHVSGKDFAFIIQDETGQPAKTKASATNVYVGKLIDGSVTVEVNKISGKITQTPFFPLPRVKIHNLSPTTAIIPLEVTDKSKLTGKEYIKDMLSSNAMRAVIEDPSKIIINISNINRYEYEAEQNQTCFMGYTVITRSAPFLDIDLSIKLQYLVYHHEEAYHEEEIFKDNRVAFLYPKSISLPDKPSRFSTSRFQPLVPLQLWSPADGCRGIQVDEIPTCKDGDADSLGPEECPKEEIENVPNYRKSIPEEGLSSESSSPEDNSSKLDIISRNFHFWNMNPEDGLKN